MDKQQLVTFALSVIPTFSGEYDHLGAFLDSIKIVQSLAGEKNEEFLFLIIKSRIIGPARAFIPKYCSSIEEILTCFETNIVPDSSKALAAKLKAISRDIHGDVNVVGFVEHAEQLIDRLVYAFVAEEKQLMNQAKSSAINVCAKIFAVTPDVKNPRDVLAKYVDSVVNQKPKRSYA